LTLQYYVIQVCLISSSLPWAPHIAIIRSKVKKGKFNALARNHTHWAIWEHHLMSQVSLSFEKKSKLLYKRSWGDSNPAVPFFNHPRWHSRHPKESQVQLCLGISYMLAPYNFGFMFSTLVLNLYSRMSKGLSVGELVDGRWVYVFDRQLQIKVTHQSVHHSYRVIIQQNPQAFVYIWLQVQMNNYRIKCGIITNNIKFQFGLYNYDGLVQMIKMDILFFCIGVCMRKIWKGQYWWRHHGSHGSRAIGWPARLHCTRGRAGGRSAWPRGVALLAASW
jgi:hypothetical protein